MGYFRYKAVSDDGKPTTGLVDAMDKTEALRLLRDKKLFVISLAVSEESSFTDVMHHFQRISFTDVVNITRQLSTMITAGLSLPEALTILRAQATNPQLVTMLEEIERTVVGGGTLAAALSRYPKQFTSIYISLVRAGETSGLLDKVLARLSETMEAERDFKGKVSGALIYPTIIVVGMVVVVGIMMVVVMPKLSELYTEFDLELPAATKLLIGIADFISTKWWLAIIMVIGTLYAFRKWHQTVFGEYLVDSLILKLPVYGNLMTKSILVEFTRTLSMLISSGIHILDALKILRDSMGNVVYRTAIDDVTKKVEKGFPLGETFAKHKEFPVIVSQMVKVGEETGKLDETLLKLSTYFQSEVEILVRGLTTALEPIIMVVLGVGVGFIIISVITPIYNLTTQFK